MGRYPWADHITSNTSVALRQPTYSMRTALWLLPELCLARVNLEPVTLVAYERLLIGTFANYVVGDTLYIINGSQGYLDFTPSGATTASTAFITMIALPEPTIALLCCLGAMALMRRRRVSKVSGEVAGRVASRRRGFFVDR